MNKIILYTLFYYLFCGTLSSQVINVPIKQGSAIFYNHKLYCFGLNPILSSSQFLIYQLDLKLTRLDSIVIEIPKNSKENYLNFQSDTLNNFLNIYLQEKNSKQVDIIRIDKSFKLISQIKKVDVARINNNSVIGNNSYSLKNKIFAIKSAQDTNGLQYYLNKYSLKSESENFDYQLLWQYPLERKNIHSVQILKADTLHVFLRVFINKGNKSGDWLLKIDSKFGKLIKASKLGDKNDNATFLPGKIYSNSTDKSIWMFGQKLMLTQFDPVIQNQTINSTNNALVYIIGIDSLGEIIDKREFKIPINNIQQGVKKMNSNFFLKFCEVTRLNSGRINIEIDVFKNESNPLCFYYTNTQILSLVFDGEKYQLDKTSISPNLEIENFYRNKDKLNMTGKICIDSTFNLNKIYTNQLISPTKIAFKFDESLNGYWILSKFDALKQVTNISKFGPVNKIYQLKNIENISSTTQFNILVCSQNIFIIGYQLDENNFQLKLNQW